MNKTDYAITKTKFFEKYGSLLVKVDDENVDFGDHLILYPEEIDKAQRLLNDGMDIYTVYEEVSEDKEETLVKGLDTGAMVVGYFALQPFK